MKRIHTSYLNPGEGAVYRDLSGCYGASSSEECGECLGSEVVAVISPPGCATFPVTDNSYGRLPTAFAGDFEIDTYGFDDRFADIVNPFTPPDPDCPDPPEYLAYPDLWNLLGSVAGLQAAVLQDSCYCPGDGIDRPTLTIGRPSFPRVAPLPFFAFPTVRTTRLTVRRDNPDGEPLPGECCPEGGIDGIEAEIVGGELRLQRRERKKDYEYKYRADDTNAGFQLKAGYPRNCCVKNPCAPSGTEEYEMRSMHFPRWPGPNSIVSNYDANGNLVTRTTRNPYGTSNAEEPFALIPRVIDIQCYDDGKLYVYYANDIIQDGHFAGLQWNTLPPRHDSIPFFRPANLPPIAPEDLEINKDWQDRDVIADFTPLGEYCDANCTAAASAVNAEGCYPTCPDEETLCGEDTQYIVYGYAESPAAAIDDAFQTAEDDTPGGCDPGYYLCYVTNQVGLYEAAVTFCC